MKKTAVVLSVLSFAAVTVMAADSTKMNPTPKDSIAKPAAPVKEAAPTTHKAEGHKAEAQKSSAAKTEKKMEAKWNTSKSGLKWIDEVIGKGDEAVVGATVEVHYTGWLDEGGGKKGKKFDSSVDRKEPTTFTLGAGQMIKGFDEGYLGMKIGGKRELIVPPSLGYAAAGFGGGIIPPNATLIFDIELLKVTKAK